MNYAASISHSFTPPAVIPAIKYRWSIANRIMIGMTPDSRDLSQSLK